MKRTILLVLAFSLPGFAQSHQHAPAKSQHEGMQMPMRMSATAGMKVEDDAAAHTLTVTLGPLNLPAKTPHDRAEQIAPQVLTIPFDGWITAYHPALITPEGQPITAHLLHHVAFWNEGRSDFLCPNKLEHIFGAGGEMNDWPALPGFGYRVHQGDRIRITTMFHNLTVTDYPQTLLRVKIDYATDDANLKSVYPAWFDAKECGDSDFPLLPNGTKQMAFFDIHYNGRLLGVGGHMHDYGALLTLEKFQPTVERIATLPAKLDDKGQIISMPVVTFLDRGGFPLKKGDRVQVEGTYGKTAIPDAHGMAIVVGYFLPDSDAEMAKLARKTRPGKSPQRTQRK